MKFPSDKSFFEFIGKGGKTPLLIIILLALALLLLPTLGQGDSADDLEGRTAELCSSVSGVGECRVMITYRGEEVYAIAVVCEGADSTAVRGDITELLTSIYGIGANRVEILPLK